MAKSRTRTLALALTFLLGLIGAISAPGPANALPDEAKWSRVNIPGEGESGQWALASDSNVQHLTMAADGTLYSYANPSGTSYRLFRSTDAGATWTATGKVKDTISDIATAPDDAAVIYYATASSVHKSVDAGANFTLLPLSPGGAGSDNIEITSIAVTLQGNNNLVAVGTRDTDAAQYGGVHILDEASPFSGWVNTNAGNIDVYRVAFSPEFTTDRQLLAVATDETDTFIISRISDNDWGTIIGDARIEALTPVAATIAFPDNYDIASEDSVFFVAIDSASNNGDVYKVYGMWAPDSSTAIDLNIGAAYNLDSIDISGLAVSGSAPTASLLAGAAGSTQVYISTDGGTTWTRSRQKPTGQSQTRIIMAPDFTASGTIYAATSGTESAFSYSTDGGVTWKQASLIDTKISDNGIIDLAVSPDYSRDSALFMLTFNGEHIEHSLWRSLSGGAKWERLLTGTLADADSLSHVRLSPQYGSQSQNVFLAGSSGGTPAIWKSTDNGQSFIRLIAPLAIDILVVAGDNTLFLGSYDGSNGLVYRTTSGDLPSATDNTTAGSQPLSSIALSPDYTQDKTLLAGNSIGFVHWSDDNGNSFRQLGQQLPPNSSATGAITVTFDPRFSSNRTVYAASDVETTTGNKKRVFRFIIGKSDAWESIDGSLPAGSRLSQITVSDDGTLYATNLQAVDTVNKKGGMERSLNPAYPLGPGFETVTRGLDDSATLSGLWRHGSQLWSIDTRNTRLMTYNDSLTQSVTLTAPPDGMSGADTGNVSLDWETLKGATGYQWQLNYDDNFSTIPDGFEGETASSSARLPSLQMNTTYYWRVRATEPVLSRWSEKRSFTTSLGTQSTTITAPELYSPEAGASGVPIKPVFQWSAIAGADSYELIVSTDASFSNPTILKIESYALPATAWQSTTRLDYDTTYYWKVRASSPDSYSSWSAVGAFTTEALPGPQPPEKSAPTVAPSSSPVPSSSPPPPSTLPPSQPAPADWIIYLIGALMLTIILLSVILLVVVSAIRRA